MKKAKSKKQSKLEFGTPVMVTWRDTSGSGGWSSLHDAPPEPPHVKQLGYFLAKDDRTLYLCQGIPFLEYEEDNCQILAPTSIPLGCITEIKRMR